jgi:hypothetical protein
VNYNNAIANLSRATGTTLELNRVRVVLPSVVEGTWPNTQNMPGGEASPRTGPAGTMPGLTRPWTPAPSASPAAAPAGP